jgi:glycosyltransferase involved in cell wall biosynthesis
MNKKAILIFYTFRSTFVKKDIDILSENFHVIEHNFYVKRKSETPVKLLSQLVFLILNIYKSELLICQFAGYHSFLPSLFAKLFNKPCIIIAGGTESHCFPGIGYGNWQKGLLKFFTAWSFKFCSHIAPKHQSLIKSSYTYDENEPALQGIYAHMPELKTPYTEITNAYDTAQWYKSSPSKINTFITVATGWEYPFQVQLKGIDLILEAAVLFPDYTFTIVGVPASHVLKPKSENVLVLPPLKNNDLRNVFSKSAFYIQISMAEGFPNSLCEAMLCECIPIGSDVFSIPEIIGKTGFILKKRSITELSEIIKIAVETYNPDLGTHARKRIATRYPLTMRKDKLLSLCNQLISAPNLLKNKVRLR